MRKYLTLLGLALVLLGAGCSDATSGSSTTGPSVTPMLNSVQVDGACSTDKDCANGLACEASTHTCRPSV